MCFFYFLHIRARISNEQRCMESYGSISRLSVQLWKIGNLQIHVRSSLCVCIFMCGYSKNLFFARAICAPELAVIRVIPAIPLHHRSGDVSRAYCVSRGNEIKTEDLDYDENTSDCGKHRCRAGENRKILSGRDSANSGYQLPFLPSARSQFRGRRGN